MVTRLLVQAQLKQNPASSLHQQPSPARNDKGRNPLSRGAKRVDKVGRVNDLTAWPQFLGVRTTVPPEIFPWQTPSQLHTWSCHQLAPYQPPKLQPPAIGLHRIISGASRLSNSIPNHGPHQPSRSRFHFRARTLISSSTDDPRETSFLFERLSGAVQRFNAVSFTYSFGLAQLDTCQLTYRSTPKNFVELDFFHTTCLISPPLGTEYQGQLKKSIIIVVKPRNRDIMEICRPWSTLTPGTKWNWMSGCGMSERLRTKAPPSTLDEESGPVFFRIHWIPCGIALCGSCMYTNEAFQKDDSSHQQSKSSCYCINSSSLT